MATGSGRGLLKGKLRAKCWDSEEDANGHTTRAVLEVVEAHHGRQHPAVRRYLVPVWKGDDQPHSYAVMRHGGSKEQAVARKVDHLANILDLRIAGVKWPHVYWERNLEALTPPGVAFWAVAAAGGALVANGRRFDCFE